MNLRRSHNCCPPPDGHKESPEHTVSEEDTQVSDPNSESIQVGGQNAALSGNTNSSSVLPDKHFVVNINELPYPAQLETDKKMCSYSQFLDVFKNLRFNIPFLDAILNIPDYAKFLKNFLSTKNRKEMRTVKLTEKCSAILQSKLPPKLGDPGSFTLPCELEDKKILNALCDLGASINLIPLSLCRKFNLGKIRKSNMRLQMADKTMKKPVGIVDDVLVKIGTFIFPADFVVLDMEEDADMPLIIGRPLLRTARALIDVHQGKLIVRLNDKSLEFKMNNSAKMIAEHDTDPACPTNTCEKTFAGCKGMANSRADQALDAG